VVIEGCEADEGKCGLGAWRDVIPFEGDDGAKGLYKRKHSVVVEMDEIWSGCVFRQGRWFGGIRR
jgi:hypothetical protein